MTEILGDSNKTYEQIARDAFYSASYIKRFVAPQLWKLLSEAWGEKITKANFIEKLNREIEYPTLHRAILEPPYDAVPLNSPYYIDRPPIETDCYQEILNDHALIRVTAPRHMGKTSLISRIVAHGKAHNYHGVWLTLNLAESELFLNPPRFFRWFCANLTRQLPIPSQLDDYWDEDIGYLMSCTFYMRSHVLETIDAPIILILDEVNVLFDYLNLARDFFSMLRAWHEESKDAEIWQKLRLVISNSTEVYVNLDANCSPFNVGMSVVLPPFDVSQMIDLSRRHGLSLSENEIDGIAFELGGFPALIRQLFYEIVRRNLSLEEALQDAATEKGIFSRDLQEKLDYLQQNPDLAETYRDILCDRSLPVLEHKQIFQLKSLGLIHWDGKAIRVSCDLYRQYFGDRL
ncbi:MAG: AAA-like domain-containing protein [Limnospira sp.]